jgi:tRNA-2-methylthio-N6-dimethylallyladenosine synthase
VADLIKADRLNRLNAVVMEVATQRAQRFQGRNLEVMVEGVNPKNPSQAFGRLRHNKLVYFDGDGVELRGKLVMVKIDQCNAYSLFGDMVEVMPDRAPLLHMAAASSSQQQRSSSSAAAAAVR